jgi:hypothetical protein
MADFPRNFRDNLRVNGRRIVIAAIGIAILFAVLVVTYSLFDLGTVLPKRRP